jgi:hypothetical protein
MPTQTIGTIKVVVNNQDLGPLTVKQGPQADSKVRTISYGQPLELKKAIDLDRTGATSGEAIVYNEAKDIFEVAQVIAASANTANTVLTVIGGTF